jgi:hypothetical protein
MNKFLHVLNTLQIGDRIVVPKSTWNIVQHHAIYIGYWNSQHWFVENKEGYGVRVASAFEFFNQVEKITEVRRFIQKPGYNRDDLYRYALSRVGRPYKMLTYNCEHFANEIQYRIVRSKQTEAGFGLAFLGLVLLIFAGARASNK